MYTLGGGEKHKYFYFVIQDHWPWSISLSHEKIESREDDMTSVKWNKIKFSSSAKGSQMYTMTNMKRKKKSSDKITM